MTTIAIALTRFDAPSGWAALGCASLLALAGAMLLIPARRRLAGTTMTAPLCWAAISLAAQTALLAACAWQPPGSWNAPLGYAAAITSFGPLVAVLGAKRPQDRAWQLIVLTLLVVLALPSGEFLLLRRSIPFTLHWARAWFIVTLAAVGWFNYLPTRYWLSATCFSLAQLCQLAAYLPWLLWPRPALQAWLGLCLSVASAGLAITARRRAPHASWDRVWIDFRDMLGAVWGLRVMERFNAAVRAGGLPVELTWHGLAASRPQVEDSPNTSEAPDTGLRLASPDTQSAVARHLKPLVRRFVSDAWIAARLVGRCSRSD